MARDKAGHHEQILAAAWQEFLTCGFADASMRRIAAASGMSAAGLYKHFPSKEEMFAALVEPAFQGLMALYRQEEKAEHEALQAGTVSQKWQTGGEARLTMTYVYDHLDAFRLLVCKAQGTRYESFLHDLAIEEEKTTMEKVIEAAKKARCHDFITALPDGYDTIIGEGGASLSGGEKQRISIARAIMKDAPIIILDEATANVDPENETELTEAIEELTKEKTIIMIAHRLKTVRHADQIFVVDSGHIAQHGTHDELIKQDGIYKSFVEGRQEAASWKIA